MSISRLFAAILPPICKNSITDREKSSDTTKIVSVDNIIYDMFVLDNDCISLFNTYPQIHRFL